MPSWSRDDVMRSVRRYVGVNLGQPWEIRLQRVEVADDARPAGVLEAGVATTTRSRVALQQGNVEQTMPVTVTLYPAIGEERAARLAADALSQQLHDLMAFGDGALPADAAGRPISGPERVPLWDYAGVAVSGDAAARAGPEQPYDRLWVEDYSTRAIQDPEDPKRWTVVLELRVSWERPGRVTDVGAPVVSGVGPATADVE